MMTARHCLRLSSATQFALDRGPATAFNTYIGYARAAEVVKRALREQKTIIDVVREEKLLSEAQIAQILNPIKLTEPGLPGR
jgi:aspartate ammonia-lyase